MNKDHAAFDVHVEVCRRATAHFETTTYRPTRELVPGMLQALRSPAALAIVVSLLEFYTRAVLDLRSGPRLRQHVSHGDERRFPPK